MGDQSSKKLMRKCCQIFFCLDSPSKVPFHGDLPSVQTPHHIHSQPNPIKKTHANQLISLRQISKFPGVTKQTQIICTYSHIFLTILSSTSCSFDCTLLAVELFLVTGVESNSLTVPARTRILVFHRVRWCLPLFFRCSYQ